MIDHKRHFGELRLIAGNANPLLAERIAAELGQPLDGTNVGRFADGEVQVDLDCVVRGTDVFVIQPICQSHSSPLRRPCLADRASGGSGDNVCTYQSINDNLIELTPSEFELLYVLMESPGYAFTRDELLAKALGYVYEGMGRTLDSHIKNLRKKIEPDPKNPTYIQTIYGVGYKLIPINKEEMEV